MSNLLDAWWEFLKGKRRRNDVAKFIFDSYSCRNGKGQHRAMDRLKMFARKVSKNHTRTVWILKCDIRKFFANINHKILIDLLGQHIDDIQTMRLFEEVIHSFETEEKSGIGLPLGNLTSQLFVNIYMNIFDQFIKRQLKVKYYIRFADDFVLLHNRKEYLEEMLPQMKEFLEKRLHLTLHPKKVFIATIASGVDFLGRIHFPYHDVLRTSTKRRMMKRKSCIFTMPK